MQDFQNHRIIAAFRRKKNLSDFLVKAKLQPPAGDAGRVPPEVSWNF